MRDGSLHPIFCKPAITFLIQSCKKSYIIPNLIILKSYHVLRMIFKVATSNKTHKIHHSWLKLRIEARLENICTAFLETVV